jgi:hypothetical protein
MHEFFLKNFVRIELTHPTQDKEKDCTLAITRKFIITCAPTGAIHTPSMSPYLLHKALSLCC